jgi:hypothetical protein
MILEDLEHIFRFQTTQTEDYIPTGKLDYVLIEGQNKINASVPAEHIENLVALLDNFIFDAYRDKTPVFVKTESEL